LGYLLRVVGSHIMGPSGDQWVPVGEALEYAAQGAALPLSGEYEHSVDEKGRATLPARLRDALGDAVYLARGLDGCLFLYSWDKWQSLCRQVSGLSLTNHTARIFSRMLFSATRCEVDKAGRILIPLNLRMFAGVTNQLVVVGVEDRVELWAPERWEAAMAVLRNTEDPSLAQGWAALGM
jgi:MraZ protein